MVFTTEEQELLRRAFDHAVNEAGPAPDLELLVTRRDRGRLGHVEPQRRRSVFALIPLAVLLLGATAFLMAQQPRGDVATSPTESTISTPTTTPNESGVSTPTTAEATSTTGAPAPSTSSPAASSTALGGQSWLSTGVPISDEQFLTLLGDYLGYVPGTAIRLAWSPAYLGKFEVGLFASQRELVEVGDGYCMTAYGARIGSAPNDYAGGAMCAASVEEFERLISGFGFGGGGNCAEWLGNVAYVWGVPADADSVEFRLRDGTALTADVDENGYALVAWDYDTPLAAVTYEGISAENANYLDSFISVDPQSCAEMSAEKPG